MDFGGVFVGGWQILVVLFVNRQPCQGSLNGWPARVWICSWPTRSCGVDILWKRRLANDVARVMNRLMFWTSQRWAHRVGNRVVKSPSELQVFIQSFRIAEFDIHTYIYIYMYTYTVYYIFYRPSFTSR